MSSSPLIQEAGASNLILHIQFSALPATTTNVLSHKKKKRKKGTESSCNPIFAKILHGKIISLFSFSALGEN